ncbi:MAG: cisplatin damage response ATP-dependent DNA ligase [Bryobacteraceae bacterium]|nr:cisplatin damage response ATP-dependent DNA ligase [Bryobacteraceae bacterium]
MDDLAAVCERIASYTSRLKKVSLLAAYLRPLGDDDLARAVRFLCCGPVAGVDRRGLAVGHATLRDAMLAVSGWDPYIAGLCYREVGDGGEAISLLLTGKTAVDPFTLAEAEQAYMRLAAARKTALKIAILEDCFKRYRPKTLKYFVKVITGDLRIGLQEKMVEEAVAAATGVPHKAVREANNRAGNLAKVAVAARRETLHEIEAALFHPMDFMLAKPLDAVAELADPENWMVEDKYDGIRAQAHLANGRAVLYTRGLEDVTHSYPELAAALAGLPGSAVIDGEVLAWKSGRPLAFTLLQQRLARKKVSPDLLADIPVAFMAYDLLYRDGRLLLDEPIEARRGQLEELMAGRDMPLLLSPLLAAGTTADIDRLFSEARGRWNEGLLLKRRGSVYEAGRRSGAWLKVKRPFATLDVVVTAAEQGHGRRATMLSDYTFAVKAGDRFLNVGKAYSGLTDDEIRELTRLFRSLSTERYGRVLLVRPEVVLEVAFDGIQKSARHKSGFALRFPRIVAWRRDKRPEECDTLERVEQLYEASLREGTIPA